MPTIKKSVSYIGNPNDYTTISALFTTFAWPVNVQTVFITNGWHTAFESRLGPGNNMVLAQVTYCDYCINADGSQKYHFYRN